MQSSKKFILWFTFFNLFLALNAQKIIYEQGYYVSKSKDTISGFFDIENLNYNRITFSSDKDMKASKKLYPTDVEMVKLSDNRTILPKILTFEGVEEPIFVMTILSGDVNLFKGISKKEGDVFYINAVDRPDLKRINKTDPKLFFQVYFNKCKNTKLYDVRYYDASSLKFAVINYSRDCYGSTASTTGTKLPLIRAFNVGLTSSVNLFNTKDAYSNLSDEFENQVNVNYGLKMRFDVSNSVSIGVGLAFQNKTFASKKEYLSSFWSYQGESYYAYTTYKASCTTLQIPIELTYRFYNVKSAYIPFIAVSYSICEPYNLRASQEASTIVNINGPGSFVLNAQNTGLPQPRLQLNNGPEPVSYYAASVKVGVIKSLSKNRLLEFGLVYSYDSEIFYLSGFGKNNFVSNGVGIFFNYLFSFQKKGR